MIVGIGVDVVDLARFRSALDRHDGRFEARVFTAGELAACEGRADRESALAGRFAAKEACLKALGSGWSSGVGFLDVEVLGGFPEAPRLELRGAGAERARGLGVSRAHVSISHDGPVAVSVVVLESDPGGVAVSPDRGA